MTWTLISATPSPYARKVRIALAEKKLPFTLQTEVPWDTTTQTPQYNPLEKLPVLILDDDDNNNEAIYESHYILEWLEAKHPRPALLPPPEAVDDRLFASKVQVLCDGICDALVLAFFEKQRAAPSEEWTARQMRKVDGGLKALSLWVEQSGGQGFLIGDRLTLADIAAGSVLGYLAVRWPSHPWMERYRGMKEYWQGLEARESFATTRPSPQTIKDKIV